MEKMIAKGNFYLFFSKKSSTFAAETEEIMSILEQIIQELEDKGIVVERDIHGIKSLNQDLSLPYLSITICTQGSVRAYFDMREYTQSRNQLAVITPGHIVRPVECSEDYVYTRLAISRKMLDELPNYLFSHDYAKFHHNPVCSLTDLQVERLLAIVEQLAVISSHTFEDLNHRNHMLLAQLSIGYEYLNYYRREQDKNLAKDTQEAIYAQFCDLVVEHHREHKDLKFYAEKMNYHPKYLSRIIRSATNGMLPKEWIERFVVTQAKRLIETNPNLSFKKIAMDLGFTEHSSFYRYFRRVTGIYPQAYRKGMNE